MLLGLSLYSMAHLTKNNRGFTLVELSIVLVIIGLLIGGILVAQSLIGTAKVAATVSQLQQFDAGVMSFKEKYRNLPGDSPIFGGYGRGLIRSFPWNANSLDVRSFGGGIANFWNQWNPEEFPGTCSFSGNTFCNIVFSGPTKNVAMAKIGNKNAFFIASAVSADGLNFDPNVAHYYAIADESQLQYTNLPTSFRHTNSAAAGGAGNPLKPAELLAIDSKADDGIADSGSVVSGAFRKNASGAGCAISTNPPLATCSVGVKYQTQNNAYTCTPLIRMGAQVGNEL